MSLEDLPNELVELIVEHSYLVKLASLSDLASVDACISPSLISYARRTPVHALSMVSKSIRHICMPVLYRKLLAKKGVVDAISSGTLHHYLKLNSDRLHLVKQIDCADVPDFHNILRLLEAFPSVIVAVFAPWHLIHTEYPESTRKYQTRVVKYMSQAHLLLFPLPGSWEGTLFRQYPHLDLLRGRKVVKFPANVQLAEASMNKDSKNETHANYLSWTLSGLRKIHLGSRPSLEWQGFDDFLLRHPDLRIITFTPEHSTGQNEDVPLPFSCIPEAFKRLELELHGPIKVDSMTVQRDDAGTWFVGTACLDIDLEVICSRRGFSSLKRLDNAMPRLETLTLTISRGDFRERVHIESLFSELIGQYKFKLHLILMATEIQALHEVKCSKPIALRDTITHFASDLAESVASLAVLEIRSLGDLELNCMQNTCLLRVGRVPGGKSKIVPQLRPKMYTEEPDASVGELGKEKPLDLTDEEWDSWPFIGTVT